jgi:esterase
VSAEAAARDGYVRLNGLRFHYCEWGDETATPLVLLHGLMGHARTWGPFPLAMSDRFRVLALNQRGHGETEWATDYAQQQMDEDVDAFVSALGLRRIALIGQSMGGINAYLYAARHPGVVERLVIGDVGPDVLAREPGERARTSLAAAERAAFDDPEEAVRAAQATNPRPAVDPTRSIVLANLRQRDDGRWVWR